MGGARWITAISVFCAVGCAEELPLEIAGPDYAARLAGTSQVPPVPSMASGVLELRVDPSLYGLDFRLRLDGGEGALGVHGAHLHCGAAGKRGPAIAFLVGAVPGGFAQSFELRATLTESNLVHTGCGATLDELLQAMDQGQVYVDVHSLDYPEGEVRGQIVGDVHP